jgi:hypothetical protein
MRSSPPFAEICAKRAEKRRKINETLGKSIFANAANAALIDDLNVGLRRYDGLIRASLIGLNISTIV